MTTINKLPLLLVLLNFVLLIGIVAGSDVHDYVYNLDKLEPPKIEYFDYEDVITDFRMERLRLSLSRQCGKRPTPYIAGGRDARLGEFPSYVFIYTLKKINLPNLYFEHNIHQSACGGTILTRYHILTAAHCVRFYHTLTLVKPVVQRPLVFMNDKLSMFIADRICIGKGYRRTNLISSTDLAIIKLKEPLQFNQNIQSACLPSEPHDRTKEAFAIGLGLNFNDKFTKNPLQVLPVKQYICERPYKYPGNICFNASQSLGTLCQGDSGGPVLGEQNGRVTTFGVTSFKDGDQCDDKNPNLVPLVFKDTYFYRDEILRLINRCSQED